MDYWGFLEQLSDLEKIILIVWLSAILLIVRRMRKISQQRHQPYKQKTENNKKSRSSSKINSDDIMNSDFMQFKVVVPEKSLEGEMLRIHLADGTEANVKIPTGHFGGDSFVFEVPKEQMKNPKIFEQQQQQQTTSKVSKRQQQQQLSQKQGHPIPDIDLAMPDGKNINKSKAADDIFRITTASLILDNDDDDHNSSSSFSDDESFSSTQSKSHLHSTANSLYHDLVLGLTVGLLVGSAIVVGFLVGILHATEDIYALHPIEKPKKPQPPYSNSGHSIGSRGWESVGAGATADQ